MSGLFITFEGVEGCGKSTQVARLKDRISSKGYSVVVTREPGGTPISESIRAILLDPENGALSQTTELLLYAAARAQHVDALIRPQVEAGAVVICDRFADSTKAYQGAGRKIGPEVIGRLNEIATRGLRPDITLLLDLPAEAGLARARQHGAFDRIEQEPLEFHRAVREAFLRIAGQEPGRVHTIDATQSEEAVAEAIWGHVEPRLP